MGRWTVQDDCIMLSPGAVAKLSRLRAAWNPWNGVGTREAAVWQIFYHFLTEMKKQLGGLWLMQPEQGDMFTWQLVEQDWTKF